MSILVNFYNERKHPEKKPGVLLYESVMEGTCITLSMPSGSIHHIPMPFKVKHDWWAMHTIFTWNTVQVRHIVPMSVGVLIEREVAEEYQNGGDGLPTLFSLLHPIEELAPVTFRRPTASENFTKICLFANTVWSWIFQYPTSSDWHISLL